MKLFRQHLQKKVSILQRHEKFIIFDQHLFFSDDYLFPDDSHFEKAHQYVLTSRILQSFVFICTVNGMLVVSVMCK